jgi:hypothetical protein
MRPKNLVRNDEIKRVVELARELGIPIGSIDVRIDGVTIHPAAIKSRKAPMPSGKRRTRTRQVTGLHIIKTAKKGLSATMSTRGAVDHASMCRTILAPRSL